MAFIADFHIHSKYSRACSKSLDLSNIHAWCQMKGIDLVATSDFTYPKWFKELYDKLEESEKGVYRLKKEYRNIYVPKTCVREIRFICSTEISLIYKRNGKVRKVHHIILAPNLEVVSKINIELEKIGNISSDGRPILGLDSENLLKILLSISEEIQLIPAHVWTPHFAIFGSKSGFDTVEECFGELSDHICALETGLSSDPLMNWRISKNDKYVLVSNSDAHSLQKLGREATIIEADCDYPSILNVLRNDHPKIKTIEFFPQEGKYYADGLRNEDLCFSPEESKRYNCVSPNTGKPLTIGVAHRVSDISDYPLGRKPDTANEYCYIIPLQEILSEILGVGVNTKKVQQKYFTLLETLGSEFEILKDIPINEIKLVDTVLAEAIKRMREGDVIIKPGYDGEYGVITLFDETERRPSNQMVLL